MMNRKWLKISLIILVLLLLLAATNLRVIKTPEHAMLLYHFPKERGGASAGNDIRNAFAQAGLDSDSVWIYYVGTNADGNYFRCDYTEADGSVVRYYAFDDGDCNSGSRATVLWP